MEKIKNVTNKKFKLLSCINLFLGITVLLSCLVWMILNIDKADSIVNVWLPIMLAGTFLIFISLLIQFAYKKSNGTLGR